MSSQDNNQMQLLQNMQAFINNNLTNDNMQSRNNLMVAGNGGNIN